MKFVGPTRSSNSSQLFRTTGAWGVGGTNSGIYIPGIVASRPYAGEYIGRGTGIYINGREIHPLDQQALMQLFGVTYRGTAVPVSLSE